MTDEQRKIVDELISHAVQGYEGGDMDDPQLLRASMAASSLAIAIMLRDMLDKPQAEQVPASVVCQQCAKRGYNVTTTNAYCPHGHRVEPSVDPRPWKCVACSITYRNGEPACPCGTQRPQP